MTQAHLHVVADPQPFQWVRATSPRLPPAGDQRYYLLQLSSGAFVTGHPLTLRRVPRGNGGVAFVRGVSAGPAALETHWVDFAGMPVDDVTAWALIGPP